MTIIALQSGSNGNCIYIETEKTRLLFDAGISGIQAEKRLAAHGRDIRRVQALVISHEHADHISRAGVLQRKYGLPIYLTEPTLTQAKRRCHLGRLSDVRFFNSGDTLRFGDTCVESVPTPHDGVDSSAFVIEENGTRVGVLTDLGHVFDGLAGIIASLNAVLLESNYDPALLDGGSYPPSLKRRIRGRGGHISNIESAELLARAASPRMVWACLSHLSEQNNNPELALRTHRERLPGRIQLAAASRYRALMLPEV